jgi:hypothetical protein
LQRIGKSGTKLGDSPPPAGNNWRNLPLSKRVLETFSQISIRKMCAIIVRRNGRSSHRLGLESLESRQLMAVLASVTDGDLVVNGDNQADQVTIIQSLQNGTPIPGRYFITGQNGTTINGQAGLFFENVTDDILINLNGNNDRLTLGNDTNGDFIVPDDLEISMGLGNDVVTIDRITVRDDATIITGDGNDSVSFKGTIGSLAGIDGGNNDLTIDTGARADNVRLENTFVRRDLNISTGTDGFADIVDLLVMNVGDDTTISTGGGGDTVRISDVGFNDDLTINTGAGADTVVLNRCQVDEFFTNLGDGTDTLQLTDTFGCRATVNGGIGADTLLRTNSLFSEFFQRNSI